MSTEHTGKSDEAARFKAEVTRLVEQGYTMDEVARIFRIRNGHQREAFKQKYTPPAVPAPSSPVAPGPAVPPEGHEGQRPLGEEEIAWIERVARDKSDAYADARDALRALRVGGITEEGKEKVRGLMRSWRCWPEVPSGDVLQLVAEVRRLKSDLIFLAVRFRDHVEKDGKDSEVAQWLTDLIAREVFDPEVIRKSMEDFAAGRGRELGEIMADLQAARREAGEMRGDREVMS